MCGVVSVEKVKCFCRRSNVVMGVVKWGGGNWVVVLGISFLIICNSLQIQNYRASPLFFYSIDSL